METTDNSRARKIAEALTREMGESYSWQFGGSVTSISITTRITNYQQARRRMEKLLGTVGEKLTEYKSHFHMMLGHRGVGINLDFFTQYPGGEEKAVKDLVAVMQNKPIAPKAPSFVERQEAEAQGTQLPLFP